MTETKNSFDVSKVRPKLFGLAYRMLGIVEDAEDAVQETLARWHQADKTAIENEEAWIMTVCSRHCIDKLRSVKAQRKTYVGPWLPEPILAEEFERSPEDLVELSEDLSIALLVVLERLSPVERAAYLLHDVFDYSHTEVSSILQKSEAACRQVISRARKRVHSEKPRFDVSEKERLEVMEAFYSAIDSGDVEIVESYLSKAAEMWSDGGGKATAALNVIYGANKVARFFCGIFSKETTPQLIPCRINGELGALLYTDGQLEGVVSLSFDGKVLDRIFVVRNPDKLRGIPQLLKNG